MPSKNRYLEEIKQNLFCSSAKWGAGGDTDTLKISALSMKQHCPLPSSAL